MWWWTVAPAKPYLLFKICENPGPFKFRGFILGPYRTEHEHVIACPAFGRSIERPYRNLSDSIRSTARVAPYATHDLNRGLLNHLHLFHPVDVGARSSRPRAGKPRPYNPFDSFIPTQPPQPSDKTSSPQPRLPKNPPTPYPAGIGCGRGYDSGRCEGYRLLFTF